MEYAEPHVSVVWEYSGEYIKHCQECDEPIKEKDIVSYVTWTYGSNDGIEIWHHPVCWEKGEFVNG